MSGVLYITAGEEMNAAMARRGFTCVPFNEAMIAGRVTEPLFSDAFIRERCRDLGAGEAEYREKIAPFLEAVRHIDAYDRVVLRFGDEPFCRINLLAVLAWLDLCGYRRTVVSETVDEQTGMLLHTEEIRCAGCAEAFQAMLRGIAPDLPWHGLRGAAERYINERNTP